VPRSPRLAYARHTIADYPESAAMWGDERVARFIGGQPSTLEDSWLRLLRYVGHWGVMDFGYWVVRDKHSGRFIGEVGVADFHRDIDPPFGADLEAGWALAPDARGQGYGIEAVSALMRWRDASLPGTRTVCMINPDNAPSIRLAAKCGFGQYARAIYKAAPVLLFERHGAPDPSAGVDTGRDPAA